MKLTDAMRLADKLEIPDLRKGYIEMRVVAWGGEKPPSCAIGGAAIAAGLWSPEFTVAPDGEQWLTSLSQYSAAFPDAFGLGEIQNAIDFCCPACENRESALRGWQYLRQVIIHLYDDHLWARTQIADWLDQANLQR